MDLRTRAVRGIDQLGLGRTARRVRAALEPWHRRRNALDDRTFALLVKLSVPRDGACVDVGANVGTMLASIVDGAPDGRHLAFEPVPWLAADLRARFPQVTVHEAAVSDVAGEASFVVMRDRPSRSTLAASRSPGTYKLDAETVTVPTVRLDDVLDTEPALVKIDVEGAELEVLRGARRMLAAAQPTVAFEFGRGNDPINDERCEAVFAEIDGAGLRIFDFDGVHLPWPEFQRVYRSGSRWNFVAHR